ncbi:MAG: PBSX family phage terminase large subunit [Clostridia bacterium]|nr:PBSX family phage terminase large subunit [Clostridia bacterium]MBQ6613781.1 PBSX family phage terminase large subunit [Clostridia bacterium]
MKDALYLPDIVGGGYADFWHTKARYRVVKGSRASKKSKTTALWYIYHMLKHKEANLIVVRRTYRTLERSAYAELRWAINRLSAEKYFEFKASPLEIRVKETGQKIFFQGLDDPLKLTSLTVSSGVLCWMWIEEAYEVESEDAFNTLDESIRGEVPNGLFKQITLTFNPWSENHWIKKRFFDRKSDDVFTMTVNYKVNEWLDDADRRMFEDMRVRDPERYRVSGLGEWGVGGGQFFPEFSYERHIVPPMPVQKGVRIYRALDYGLDALACLFIAVDSLGRATVFREVYAHDLIVSAAAEAIREASLDLDIYCTFAPPDLWARQKDSGKSIASLFSQYGIPLTASDNNRVGGWMALKEWFNVTLSEDGTNQPRMKISSACENLIRCLPSLIGDKKRVGDCLTEPHEITHLPDALRYFAVMQTRLPHTQKTVRISDFTGKSRRKNRF